MANINRKRTEVIRIPKEVRDLLKELSFDLSAIEKNRVTIPEICNRTFKSPAVIDKLKIGALERKQIKK